MSDGPTAPLAFERTREASRAEKPVRERHMTEALGQVADEGSGARYLLAAEISELPVRERSLLRLQSAPLPSYAPSAALPHNS